MSAMDCGGARGHLLDYQRGRLDPGVQAAIRAHLAACAACAREAEAEAAVTELLEQRLPQHPASPALKRRLAAQLAAEWPAPARPRPGARARWWTLAPALAAALVLVVVAPLAYQWSTGRGARGGMVDEAVNDHLRIVAGLHPLQVEAGGIHQVKPWFAGKLDFAPVVTFGGDAEFPLKGGAIDYFLDRKAAVFVYQRRLHTVSLLVFRAEGLPWPGGGRRATVTERGFTVLLWRVGDLGYALVSDLEPQELAELAARVGG